MLRRLYKKQQQQYLIILKQEKSIINYAVLIIIIHNYNHNYYTFYLFKYNLIIYNDITSECRRSENHSQENGNNKKIKKENWKSFSYSTMTKICFSDFSSALSNSLVIKFNGECFFFGELRNCGKQNLSLIVLF